MRVVWPVLSALLVIQWLLGMIVGHVEGWSIGDASYFTIEAGDSKFENAVWSYETPFPAMTEITGYLAFYPNKVTIET